MAELHCSSKIPPKPAASSGEHARPHHHGGGNPLITSAQATLHCLTGCVIGEGAGKIKLFFRR